MAQKIAHGVHSMDDGSIITFPYDDAFDWSRRGFIPPNIAIHQVDIAAVQQFPIGTKLVRDDATYRYCEFQETTAAGDLLERGAIDAAHDVMDFGVAAAGTTTLECDDSKTFVLNEYAGGRLTVADDTGQGYDYRILSNTAVTGATGAQFVIQEPGLAVAIDATSDVVVSLPRWKEVLLSNTTIAGAPVGVSKGIGADGSFGWVGTNGLHAVRTKGTVVLGQGVIPAAGQTGAVAPNALTEATPNTFIAPLVGYVVDVGATDGYSLVDFILPG